MFKKFIPSLFLVGLRLGFLYAQTDDIDVLRARILDLYASNITVLQNDNNIIPLNDIKGQKIAVLAVNTNTETHFQKIVNKYLPAGCFIIQRTDSQKASEVLSALKGFDLIIAGVYNTDTIVQGGDYARSLNNFIAGLSSRRLILTWFGHPQKLSSFEAVQSASGLLVSYSANNYTESLSAQLIFGGTGAEGILPVTINDKWIQGYGLKTTGGSRIRYGFPENAGLSSTELINKIDSIVNRGLAAGAYPGCEVMVARNGILAFSKCYGFHTYDSVRPVNEKDLFDLASVTKISSTLAGLMVLDSEGKFDPDETLGHYLPWYRWSDKNRIQMREILTHQAGLTSWIPFWKSSAGRDGNLKKKFYSPVASVKFPYKVADSLYIKHNYRNRIFREIRRSPTGEKKYLYSDLGFIISPSVIESVTGRKWYDFVTEKVYRPIGACEMGFNPYKNYPLERIVPTEYDSLFRRQLIHGYVHDEGAAMLDGISGHAGLFSTGGDLMKLIEMYRRMGNYAGVQIIDSAVLRRYTKVQFPENDNRRGIGFDKPLLNNKEVAPADTYPTWGASPESFGHTGFTGTMVWIDPVKGISFLFLSNRVHPTRENNLLSELDIRTSILQAIYDSIIE